MDKRTFYNIESNVSIIDRISNELKGNVLIDNQKIEAIITKENEYKIIIETILNPDNKNLFQLSFSNDIFNINIETTITSRGNKINVVEKYSQEHSEGIIYSFKSEDFDNKSKS